MAAKEWLNRGRKLNGEINALIEARNEIFNLACGTSAGSSDDKVQTSRRNTSEDVFVKYADYTRLIDSRIDELCAVKQEIMEAINKIEDCILRELLIRYYINCKTRETAAEEMGYSDKWVRTELHKTALRAIEKQIETS